MRYWQFTNTCDSIPHELKPVRGVFPRYSDLLVDNLLGTQTYERSILQGHRPVRGVFPENEYLSEEYSLGNQSFKRSIPQGLRTLQSLILVGVGGIFMYTCTHPVTIKGNFLVILQFYRCKPEFIFFSFCSGNRYISYVVISASIKTSVGILSFIEHR